MAGKMKSDRWEVTIVDHDSKEVVTSEGSGEPEELETHFETRVTASTQEAARGRAFALIREKRPDVGSHRLYVVAVRNIYKPAKGVKKKIR